MSDHGAPRTLRSTDRALGIALAVVFVAFAAGCSSVPDRSGSSIDYRSTVEARKTPLDIPPDLASVRSDDRFSIPDRGGADAANTLSDYQRGQDAPRRESAADRRVLPTTANVRQERAGAQRWLVVDRPAEAVLPVVREFWQQAGFTLAIDAPELGIVETDWAENRAKLPQGLIRRTIGRVLDSLYSTGERDRYRTRIERNGDATEIYIAHRGLIEVYSDDLKTQTRWQPRPSDAELEAEFLHRLQLRLAGDTNPNVAAAPVKPAVPDKARIVGDALEVDDAFDRAWRRVGLALDRAGFTVEDRDRGQGLFYVRYVEADRAAQSKQNSGFFSRLFTSEKKAPASQQYRVSVAASGERATVKVFDKDGNPGSTEPDKRVAERILALLRDELK